MPVGSNYPHNPQASAPPEGLPAKDPSTLTGEEVRQGQTGHGVRYVLAVSLAAALVGLFAVYFVYLN